MKQADGLDHTADYDCHDERALNAPLHLGPGRYPETRSRSLRVYVDCMIICRFEAENESRH